MPAFKKWLKKYIPKRHELDAQQGFHYFGKRLHDPNLWHFNRRSVASAVAIGLFCAFMPIPSQMVLAAFVAITYRVNLPISVALVWITNPITIPPIFYLAYRLGAVILNIHPKPFEFELSLQWLAERISDIWQPLLLGSFILGTTCAAVGFFTVHMLWRLFIARAWKERRANRLLKKTIPD